MAKPCDILDRTFDFAVKVVKLAVRIEDRSQTSRVLVRQLVRAGTAVGSSLEEGQAAESKADFIHKYRIALKEAREVRYWLRLLKAVNPASGAKLDELIKESEELARIIAQIVVNVARSAPE